MRMAQTQIELIGFFGMVALIGLISFVVYQADPPRAKPLVIDEEKQRPRPLWPDDACDLIGMEKTGETRRTMIGRLYRIEHETMMKWNCDSEIVTAPRWKIWR